MPEKARKNKKKAPWCRLRHRLVQAIVRPLFRPYVLLRYRVRLRRFRDRRPAVVLFNHQTAFDQFFVSLSFRRTVYYMATEDLFSMGWLSRLVAWLVAPIPIRKSMTDARAVMTALRVAREGGTIALAPEGNRTYSGRTGAMKPSIAAFVRALRLPLVLYRIEGGYGVHPRWADKVRRGGMEAGVVRVLEREELAQLSDEALLSLIEKELYRDESLPEGEYPSPHAAEYLERALYYCPTCGIAHQRSEGDVVTCTVCGRQVRYRPDKSLSGVGEPFPYATVLEWIAAEEAALRSLALAPYTDTPLFCDTVALYEEIPYRRKRRLVQGVTLAAYGDRFELSAGEVRVLPFTALVATSVLGRNKLNLYVGAKTYQIKGDRRFCALFYMNLFYRAKNEREGDQYAEFLGI